MQEKSKQNNHSKIPDFIAYHSNRIVQIISHPIYTNEQDTSHTNIQLLLHFPDLSESDQPNILGSGFILDRNNVLTSTQVAYSALQHASGTKIWIQHNQNNFEIKASTLLGAKPENLKNTKELLNTRKELCLLHLIKPLAIKSKAAALSPQKIGLQAQDTIYILGYSSQNQELLYFPGFIEDIKTMICNFTANSVILEELIGSPIFAYHGKDLVIVGTLSSVTSLSQNIEFFISPYLF